jgi:outer membrane protein
VADRLEAGLASELDLERANANVERAKQDVADALLSQQLAARNLETLSRVKPEAATVFPEDDLHDEGSLDSWVAAIDPNMPERRMSEAERRLAEASRDAAKLTFAPVLSAQAQERLTNATGFTGRVGTYALSATLTFRFDFGQIAQLDAAKAAQEGAVARAEGTRRTTEDTVAEAYNRINANLAKARAARAQAKATDRAAVIAEDRYQAGTSTELDVTQAQRDAFSANVARIQSDLDLAQARAVLRIAAGKPLSFRNPGDKIQ